MGLRWDLNLKKNKVIYIVLIILNIRLISFKSRLKEHMFEIPSLGLQTYSYNFWNYKQVTEIPVLGDLCDPRC